eukprot:740413-Pleurochrysis_carterae.AAC.1
MTGAIVCVSSPLPPEEPEVYCSGGSDGTRVGSRGLRACACRSVLNCQWHIWHWPRKVCRESVRSVEITGSSS